MEIKLGRKDNFKVSVMMPSQDASKSYKHTFGTIEAKKFKSFLYIQDLYTPVITITLKTTQ